MKPTYLSPCGRVELYHADALDVLPHLQAGVVDVMRADLEAELIDHHAGAVS